ncbi:MAG: hypothetical protein DSY76_08510 [Bacteroidetes bacterium]|nr:MAG: hypothetical protein DSY76_08510 [Bacteroidota bacterium]
MKYIRIFIKTLILLIFTLFSLPFIISPVYDFPEPTPFSGDKIWNPYQNIDTNNWRKGNFQIQALAWGGMTDGSNNPTDSVFAIYNRLGYDIIGISDYQKINTYYKGNPDYIPIYEHGFNARKTHQVSIGMKDDFVLWLDFPFYQTTSQKQFIINLLRPHTEILALVHPDFSLEGYSHENLKYLTNYDLLEALNHQRFSISHWDAVLSSGHAKYILANDDAHNILNPFLVGVVSTYINAPTTNREDIIAAMKEGKTYGFVPYTPDNDDYTKKAERAKHLPLLKEASLQGNHFTVRVDGNPVSIQFVGQDGVIKKEVKNTNTASYDFQKEDTYIRTKVDYGRAEFMLLNPVFRYSGDNPLHEELATINWWKTILFRGAYLLFFIFVFRFILRKKCNKA